MHGRIGAKSIFFFVVDRGRARGRASEDFYEKTVQQGYKGRQGVLALGTWRGKLPSSSERGREGDISRNSCLRQEKGRKEGWTGCHDSGVRWEE